jgi:hypothetical protein
MSWLSCTGCLVLPIQSWLACPGCPVLAILSWQPCPDSPVPAACHGCIFVVLLQNCWQNFHANRTLAYRTPAVKNNIFVIRIESGGSRWCPDAVVVRASWFTPSLLSSLQICLCPLEAISSASCTSSWALLVMAELSDLMRGRAMLHLGLGVGQILLIPCSSA